MGPASVAWEPPRLPPRLESSRQLPLVGRRRELETLDALWSEVERARRQVLFIGGEPGAGKTRLVAEAAGALHDIGVAVLVGTSTRDAGVPYQPFVEMLDQLFSAAPAGTLASAVESGGPLLRLSGEAVRHGAVDEAASSGGEVRGEMFGAVAGFFRAVAAERPLALLLDDLHWAQLPTLALLEHVVQACSDTRLLVLATFRTTAPDRSDPVLARLAEMHRLEGVRRLDLGGLDTDAIAEYVGLRTGLPAGELRAPAALLRDRTGGNPFFLRELWADLERRGGVSALRFPQRVPGSIDDTLAARVAGLGEEVRHLIELAAVLGDDFDLPTLVAVSETAPTTTLALLDSAMAVGLIEHTDPAGQDYSFVHSLTRQAVLDRMPPSRRTLLHARAAEALERQPLRASLVPSLAHHYLAAHVLGLHVQALRYSREAGRLAERSLAFEEAAGWFERAASLPECEPAVQAELLLSAAFDYVRACHFPRARAIYESLGTVGDPAVRLAAAMGYEDATWRPGVAGPRAADLLAEALHHGRLPSEDPRYARALGSLGRALALAGETARARQVGAHAIALARATGDVGAISHALLTSLWHGTSPEVADIQLERSAEVHQMAKARRDFETLGSSAVFRSIVAYMLGRPAELAEALADSTRSAQITGQPYYRHICCCLAHGAAFLRGDFHEAERWADETVNQDESFGDDMTDGPRGVQKFMLSRERRSLQRFRPYFDGRETLAGRWVPGLLALYTELGIETGMRRTLQHLLQRDLSAHTDEAQWPMELVFMTEAALALQDSDATKRLLPFLAEYQGLNLVSGTLIAVFGSADRYLARIASLLGDDRTAERYFATALDMDRHMHSVVHVGETLAHHALFLASRGEVDRARAVAAEAVSTAAPIGQNRVLTLLEALNQGGGDAPAGLSDREVEVLRLLAHGLSNSEIGARLFISANTAANHVRSILQKTGCANRTQAAIYAAHHQLV
jgi:DNA-binding NarL/FixJ family response regulator